MRKRLDGDWICTAGAVLFVGVFLLHVPQAYAGKEHCRTIFFDGQTGAFSQDVAIFTAAEPDATPVNLSCPISVQANESSVQFLKRLPISWGTSNGTTCLDFADLDLDNLPKKSCSNTDAINGPSCRIKTKIAPKNGPPFKKFHVQICCFELPDCKKKLGAIDAGAIPVSIQTQVNAGTDPCPDDDELPAGVSDCQVALDPIGVKQAPHPGLAQCRVRVAKAQKAFSGVLSSMVACHKNRFAGKIPDTTDCNSPQNAESASAWGAFGQALQDAADRCAASGVSPVNAGLKTCPEPCDSIPVATCSAGNIGAPCTSDRSCDSAPGALDGRCGDWTQAVACMQCLAEDALSVAMTDKFGNTPATVSGSAADCAVALGEQLVSLTATRLKETAKCQKKLDGGKIVLTAGVAACKDDDPKGVIAKAEQQARDLILVKSGCTDPDIGELDEDCDGVTTVSQVAECVIDNARDLNDAFSFLAFPETRPKPPGACPSSARIVVAAGAGGSCTTDGDCIPGTCEAGVCRTKTSFELGFSGFAHHEDLSAGTTLEYSLSCAATEFPCGACTATGPANPSTGQCRCASDASATCDEPDAPDQDDCGGALCECFLGPPVPMNAGGTPTCALTHVSAATGTIDVDTMAATLPLLGDLRLHLGVSQGRPCPTCDGDPTPNDGVAGGTCNGGPRDGLPCDTGGVHGTFGSVSLDCPPDPGAMTSANGQLLDLVIGDGTSTLDAQVSCGGSLSALDCHCRVCSGDPSLPCNSDADCAAANAGTCSSNGSGVGQLQPNSCVSSAFVCAAGGQCDSDTQSYCDGFTRASGDGVLPCNSDTDCDVFDSECPGGDCGSCTLTQPISCFEDPLVAQGVPNTSFPTYAGVTCVAPTSAGPVNGAIGLPGPLRLRVEGPIRLPCSSDPGTFYQPAVGGCPPSP